MLKLIERMTKNIEGIDPNQPSNKAKQAEQDWIKALQGHKQRLEPAIAQSKGYTPFLTFGYLSLS
jgi:hypothetical protein